MKYGNLIYFHSILSIGGIETWLYNISVLFRDLDITIVTSKAAHPQINRIAKNVRVIVWDGKQRFECEKLFVNFNTDIIPYVKADRIYLCLHGDYSDMIRRGQLKLENLPMHPKVDEYIGISKTVCDSWKKLTGIDATLCYNPVLEPASPKVIRLVSAQRLSREKGKERIKMLANALDDICRKSGDKWIWDIYTDNAHVIPYVNIRYTSPRLDVADYYSSYDWLVQLSDNEGYCYSVVESLMRGVPCVVTDLPVFKELGLTSENSIMMNLDGSNVFSVANDILTKKLQFKYRPPADSWRSMFADIPSTYEYKEEKLMLHKVEALDTYERLKVRDGEFDRILPEGFAFEVSDERLKVLLGDNGYKKAFVKLVEEEPTEEPTEEPAEEKPKRGRKKKEG